MATEAQGYTRDLLKKDHERIKTKDELAQEKQDGKKLIETDAGKKTLAMKWIEKAKLGDAGKAAVLKEIGVTESMDPTEFILKVAEWQGKNGLEKKGETLGDGVLGWKTLEAVDNKITKEFDKNQNENDGQGSSDGGRLADVDIDEKETLAFKKQEAKEKEAKRLEGLAISTDPQDYYGANGLEPTENPLQLAEIAKSKLPPSINQLGLTSIANDINLDRAKLDNRDRAMIENGQYISYNGQGYQVGGLEKFSNGGFGVVLKPVDRDNTAMFNASALTEGVKTFTTREDLLASLPAAYDRDKII